LGIILEIDANPVRSQEEVGVGVGCLEVVHTWPVNADGIVMGTKVSLRIQHHCPES
jgi:hypothetical protein